MPRSFVSVRALPRPSMAAAQFARQPATLRAIHARAISFRAVPKAALRAFRVPAYAFGAAGGALAYANYKVDEFRGFLGEFAHRAGDRASEAYANLSDLSADALAAAQANWESLSDRVSESELTGAAGEFFRGLRERAEKLRDSLGKGQQRDGGKGSGGGDGGGGSDPAGAAAAATAAAAAASSATEPDADEESAEPKSTTEELQVLTRKLIEVRNMLKTIDHTSENLTLPSIVVIGSQSSGKSSVLEAIVGHEFLPKGNNMVTRRPIELTLVHTSSTDTRGSRVAAVEYGEFPGLGLGRITDFGQIQKTLFDLNMAVPASECVSDDPIELRIYSPRVPDLTLIDLPGYVQLSSLDQPEELRERIHGLCDRYIQEPNIILAVCAADVDLANSPALRASRKVDPLGLRTIGVVTKMDLVPPEVGSGILRNNKYPLALGYVGVVCKGAAAGKAETRSAVLAHEADFFARNAEHFRAPTRGRSAGVEPLVGTDSLRRRLMAVLEESMASSLHTIGNAVQIELEEASYQFKVQYNDRSITAESYVAETMDALKHRFKEFASHFGKPEVRALLKSALEEKVMDILAQVYWQDGRVPELGKLADDRRLSGEELDRYWQHKLDASASALTKSGIGRTSTQLVVDAIRKQIELLAQTEPFNHHPEAADRIASFSAAILRDRFGLTADQVENSVKPLKYEVEVDNREWEAGRQRSVELVERELRMCDEALGHLRKAIGARRLRGAMDYIVEREERERQRRAKLRAANAKAAQEEGEAAASELPPPDDSDDPLRPDYNSALLVKAREAQFLSDRAQILKLRIAALKARRCKTGPDAKAFCPEAFLNVVADKLTYTAVMFINIELLAEFFYAFPREIDSHLVYDLDKAELTRFARENPAIRKHLDLQERKEKLQMVMDKLDSLSSLYQDRQAPKRQASSSRWGFF